MIVNQKEIVLLPYPFSNLKNRKVRPALVISNDFFNKKSDDCIVIPLTSILKEEPYSLMITQEDLISGKLLKSSRIRVDKIFSVQKDLIIVNVGRVSNKIFEKVKLEIEKVF